MKEGTSNLLKESDLGGDHVNKKSAGGSRWG